MTIFLVILAVVAPVGLLFLLRKFLAWEHTIYLSSLALLLAVGCVFYFSSKVEAYRLTVGISYLTVGLYVLCLAACLLVFGLIEYIVLRLLSLAQIGAIARVTYYEALLQPFTIIILAICLALITLGSFFPFFTLQEDSKMFRDVASSFAFLFSLPILIFAASKVIDEEIENRTMLTLMSKPVARWQVVIGKYLGILLLMFVSVTVIGILAGVCAYLRYFDDMRLDYYTAGNTVTWNALDWANAKAVLALIPAIVLTFMQLATLAALSVAISTRFGLALNITVIVVVYLAANLARYTNSLDLGQPWTALVTWLSYLLPSLSNLDLNQRLIYGNFNYGKEYLANTPTYSQIWSYVALAGVYSAFYIGAALSFGIALFRTRELT